MMYFIKKDCLIPNFHNLTILDVLKPYDIPFHNIFSSKHNK